MRGRLEKPPIDLQALERRAYLILWEDGLIDIVVGLGLLGLSVTWLNGMVVLGAILPALLIPVWQVARNRLAVPRSGVVELSPRRRAQEKRNLGAVAGVGAAIFALALVAFFWVPANSLPITVLIAALPSILLALPVTAVGLVFGIHRFVVYAGVLVAGGVAVVLAQAEPGWSFLPAGVVVTAAGVFLLVHFLRRYPITEPGEAA